jgi:hypothetical protein
VLSAVAYRGFSVTREYNAPKDSEVGHGGAFFLFCINPNSVSPYFWAIWRGEEAGWGSGGLGSSLCRGICWC